jgi:hypothetical protein
MNLFTSNLFTPAMSEDLAFRQQRSYREPAFGRRYGRAKPQIAHAAAPPKQLTARVVERVLRDYDLAA